MRLGFGLVLTILLGLGSPAQSQIFWQDDYYPDVYIEEPPPPPAVRPQPYRTKHHRIAKSELAATSARKPKGPIIIAISIRRQTLKIYDANGLFAETPVSTGMHGHSTPMGVFSVIQKQKWHRSNIYSDAPMPYMQRITWSGIAMHAGVLPGYPASHGCIRMPTNFAVKMWSWTKLGARVIITPGEVTPTEFSHPLLTTHRPERTPVASAVLTADASAMQHDAVTPITTDPPAADKPQTVTPEPAADPINPDIGNTKNADASAAATIKPDLDTVRTEAEQRRPVSKADVTATAQDQSQPSPASVLKAESVAIPALKRNERIAVFVSRKDSKIYVRQDFAPVFDAPIIITQGDRPLGTHVFTAEADKHNKDDFRWSVVSIPEMAFRAEQVPIRESASRQRAPRVDARSRPAPVPDSAADALNRISIPEEVMTKIADSLSTGDSIIVSDQGIAGGETGEGTDFIVTLR
ncbi:L,D-transpeptidase family protein [Nitrobacter sp. JJSN]|uniref:L,D-transpeptidase n=1 Tax=Nitrobacter sp. JJSN TaxID=3453033 RepID=UPI003F76738F